MGANQYSNPKNWKPADKLPDVDFEPGRTASGQLLQIECDLCGKMFTTERRMTSHRGGEKCKRRQRRQENGTA